MELLTSNWKVALLLVSSSLLVCAGTIFFYSKNKKIKAKKKNSNVKSKKDDSIPTTTSTNWTYLSVPKSKNTASSANSDLKGYKTTSKGNTTTYFNRELSEEDIQLIGDFSPKRLDHSQEQQSSNNPRLLHTNSVQAPSDSSVWNAAGTWEEKNISTWTNKKLTELLRAVVIDFELPEEGIKKIAISITHVNEIKGDSVVAMVRGKKKFIYDLQTSIRWKVTMRKNAEFLSKEIFGSLEILDITSSHDLEFKCQVDSSGVDNAMKKIFSKYVSNRHTSKLDLQSHVIKVSEKLVEAMKLEFLN